MDSSLYNFTHSHTHTHTLSLSLFFFLFFAFFIFLYLSLSFFPPFAGFKSKTEEMEAKAVDDVLANLNALSRAEHHRKGVCKKLVLHP